MRGLVVFFGEGGVVWCLAERERLCVVWRRGRVVVVFSGKGEVVWCLVVREG